jgi:hypothetical protein
MPAARRPIEWGGAVVITRIWRLLFPPPVRPPVHPGDVGDRLALFRQLRDGTPAEREASCEAVMERRYRQEAAAELDAYLHPQAATPPPHDRAGIRF